MSYPPITTHILKMDCGVTVTATLREADGKWSPVWNPRYPQMKAIYGDKFGPTYLKWRKQIIRKWGYRKVRILCD